MSVFSNYRKLLILSLILSFSIFVKGCSFGEGFEYSVGFPLNIAVFNPNSSGVIPSLGLKETNVINGIFNLILILTVLLIGIFLHKKITDGENKVAFAIFSNLFFIYTIFQNLSSLLFIFALLALSFILPTGQKSEDLDAKLAVPFTFLFFFNVFIPGIFWLHILKGLSFLSDSSILKASFLINGLIISLVGTFAFIKSKKEAGTIPNLSGSENVFNTLKIYFPYFLVSSILVVFVITGMILLNLVVKIL